MERQPCGPAATYRRPENAEGPSRPAPVNAAAARLPGVARAPSPAHTAALRVHGAFPAVNFHNERAGTGRQASFQKARSYIVIRRNAV